MNTVVPSLPASSFAELNALADAVRGTVSELQIDIVDNVFVPAVSWPFTENNPVKEMERIAEFTVDFAVEMDCMVMNPEKYLDLFVAQGVTRVIVHMRSTDAYEDIIAHARIHKYKIGFAFTNDVTPEELEPYIEKIDYIQIMGIAVVGKQGQPFDGRTLTTAVMYKEKYPNLEIAVDGSVNVDTILLLKNAGVTRFAPGSAIAKQPDPKSAYLHLLSLVS